MQMIYCFCQHLRLVYNTIYDKSMNSVVDGVFQLIKVSQKLWFLLKIGQVSKGHYGFVVGQTQLECVNQYKYLGVNVSSSGKFITAENKTWVWKQVVHSHTRRYNVKTVFCTVWPFVVLCTLALSTSTVTFPTWNFFFFFETDNSALKSVVLKNYRKRCKPEDMRKAV